MRPPLFYRRSGQGPALLLLHGYASSSLFWEPLRRELEPDFDVIAPDWLGFGRSQSLEPCRTVQEFAGRVLDLADFLELERFHVLGHSMGGFPVQELLVSHPRRLASATLYGSGLRVDKARRFESIAQTMERLERQGPLACSLPVLEKWFARPRSHVEERELCRRALQGMTVEGAAAALNAFESVDYTGRLGQAQAPVLVILGQHERSHPPASALELVQAMTQASLCVLPDCGHAAHLEQPVLFVQALRQFLLRRERLQDSVPAAC